MINNAHELDFNMDEYANVLANSTDDIINLINGKPSNRVFAHWMNKQKQILGEMIDEYMVLRRPFLNLIFKDLFGMVI
jgi:hypothetical protein